MQCSQQSCVPDSRRVLQAAMSATPCLQVTRFLPGQRREADQPASQHGHNHAADSGRQPGTQACDAMCGRSCSSTANRGPRVHSTCMHSPCAWPPRCMHARSKQREKERREQKYVVACQGSHAHSSEGLTRPSNLDKVRQQRQQAFVLVWSARVAHCLASRHKHAAAAAAAAAAAVGLSCRPSACSPGCCTQHTLSSNSSDAQKPRSTALRGREAQRFNKGLQQHADMHSSNNQRPLSVGSRRPTLFPMPSFFGRPTGCTVGLHRQAFSHHQLFRLKAAST
jgi:hypothetical protein